MLSAARALLHGTPVHLACIWLWYGKDSGKIEATRLKTLAPRNEFFSTSKSRAKWNREYRRSRWLKQRKRGSSLMARMNQIDDLKFAVASRVPAPVMGVKMSPVVTGFDSIGGFISRTSSRVRRVWWCGVVPHVLDSTNWFFRRRRNTRLYSNVRWPLLSRRAYRNEENCRVFFLPSWRSLHVRRCIFRLVRW